MKRKTGKVGAATDPHEANEERKMMMKTLLACACLTLLTAGVFAKPGGTYTLTGEEKSIADIVKADMAKYPELYKGESFKRYLSKFKAENKIGRKKYKPGDQLLFPETSTSLKQKKPLTSEDLLAVMAPKLTVESHGFNQRSNRSGGSVYVAIDGKAISSTGSENLRMICINEAGYVDSFGIPWRGTKTEHEDFAEELIERIENSPPNTLIILAVSDTAHTYSPYIKKSRKQ